MVVMECEIPTRSRDQRLAALMLANEIRSRRAGLKRDLKAGRASAVRVLAEPPAWAASMRVMDLLLATPRVGRVKATRVLSRARISPSKTLAGMTDRQRGELAGLLRGECR